MCMGFVGLVGVYGLQGLKTRIAFGRQSRHKGFKAATSYQKSGLEQHHTSSLDKFCAALNSTKLKAAYSDGSRDMSTSTQ